MFRRDIESNSHSPGTVVHFFRMDFVCFQAIVSVVLLQNPIVPFVIRVKISVIFIFMTECEVKLSPFGFSDGSKVQLFGVSKETIFVNEVQLC